MDPKIDRDELAEIVEETARIAEEERALVDLPQARQILRELDLPAEHLDDTRQALATRRSERLARRKRALIVAALGLACVVSGAGLAWHAHAKAEALASISVSQSTLTLHGVPVATSLTRVAAPELVFDVVLAEAPQGASLDLTCVWRAPDGAVRYENRWQTKPVDRSLWPTHCRRAFGTGDAVGAWSVTMREGGHDLATQRFSLE
jgi:hypothetical protein